MLLSKTVHVTEGDFQPVTRRGSPPLFIRLFLGKFLLKSFFFLFFFNNILVISRHSVLQAEEVGVPRENHLSGQVMANLIMCNIGWMHPFLYGTMSDATKRHIGDRLQWFVHVSLNQIPIDHSATQPGLEISNMFMK